MLYSSFVSLVWPWSGRSLPKGNQWECWDPGLGPNVVGLLVLPATKYLTNPKTDRLISCHMAVGWLADCLSKKCQLDPPCHQISDQPEAWQVDIVTWLVGWPLAAGKLAGWLPIKHRCSWPELRCTPLTVEASSGQQQYYISSAWHVVSLSWPELRYPAFSKWVYS